MQAEVDRASAEHCDRMPSVDGDHEANEENLSRVGGAGDTTGQMQQRGATAVMGKNPSIVVILGAGAP